MYIKKNSMGTLPSTCRKKSTSANTSKIKAEKRLRQTSILKHLKRGKENKQGERSSVAVPDIVEFNEDNSQENTTSFNILFYQNKLKSEPQGDYIEQILQNWHGNYSLLEKHHGYIQWLFPTKECGRNRHAKPLNKEEILVISNSGDLKGRLVRAYEMMLDFYGFTMVNKQTGEVKPSGPHSKRVIHLKMSRHNHLRITRILSSLSLLGLEQITYPFLTELIHLAFGKDAPLHSCQHSCLDFWIPSVSDPRKRQSFRKLADALKNDAIQLESNCKQFE